MGHFLSMIYNISPSARVCISDTVGCSCFIQYILNIYRMFWKVRFHINNSINQLYHCRWKLYYLANLHFYIFHFSGRYRLWLMAASNCRGPLVFELTLPKERYATAQCSPYIVGFECISFSIMNGKKLGVLQFVPQLICSLVPVYHTVQSG